MRITYVTHTRFPTEKAHGHQVAQVCHALAELGHEVTLVTPTIGDSAKKDTHAFYGLPRSFRVVPLRQFDALHSKLVPGPLAFSVSMSSYRGVLSRYLKNHKTDLFYARSPEVLPPLLRTGVPVILELHTLPSIGHRTFRNLCNRCALVVCLTSPMRDVLLKWKVDPARLIVEGDGADPDRFKELPAPAQAKDRWALPLDRPVIGYVGSLVARNSLEKGVGQLIGALATLKKKDIDVHGWIVGGPASWREHYQKQAARLGLDGRITFHDRIPAADVPSAIAASDICIYPAPKSKHPFFHRDTSPLKLFEYLAAGKPIVCADLPPIRDVVDQSIVRFCGPGDADAMAAAIRWMLQHGEQAEEMAKEGKKIARRHGWGERMKRIVERVA